MESSPKETKLQKDKNKGDNVKPASNHKAHHRLRGDRTDYVRKENKEPPSHQRKTLGRLGQPARYLPTTT
jgi:hypothetical protein